MTPNRQHIRFRWNPVFIHILAWTIVFLFPLLFIERVESMRRIHDFSLMRFYIQPISIAIVFYINYLWLIDRVLFRKKPVQFILYNLLLIVVANVVIYLVHHMLLPNEFIPRHPGPGPRPPRPVFVQWQDSITLALMVGLSVAIKMTQKWIVTEKERQQLEQERTEAELKNLKNQLNPHFLFNTLNNIYALIAVDHNRAQRAVLELSRLMRYVLYENKERYVPVEKELNFLQDYIGLMRLRQNKQTRIDVNIDTTGCNNYRIAPLLFIPLIENAFKHGIDPMQDSFIEISITAPEEGKICCCVRNSYFPKNGDDRSGSGIGLDNIRRQLDLLYPEKYSFNISCTDNIYCAELSIDLHQTIQP